MQAHKKGMKRGNYKTNGIIYVNKKRHTKTVHFAECWKEKKWHYYQYTIR